MVSGTWGNILVVEDDDSLRSLFAKVLAQSGFGAVTASNEREARPLFTQYAFEVFICDLSAGGGRNVFEFVSYARQHQPELAVLLISGYTPDDVAVQARIFGIDTMEKPFSPPQLVEKVRHMLARKAVA